MMTGHLSAVAASKLELSDRERIRFIKSARWISYPEAEAILEQLEDLLDHPQQDRMPNMLLVGATNAGKTALIKRFLSLHPAKPNLEGDAAEVPVGYVQTPPGATDDDLYQAIQRTLFHSTPRAQSRPERRNGAIDVMRDVGMRILLIDEVQHMLSATHTKQALFLNALKFISNDLRISIVAAGPQEAVRAIHTDPHLANRFKPVVFPKWTLTEAFARLLVSFETVLPLRKPSNLGGKAMAKEVLRLSEGTIGEVSDLLNAAAIYAIKNKTEEITLDALKLCGFVQPSLRRQKASTL